MKEIEGIWQEAHRIQAHECDPFGFVRPIVIADILQEGASNHAIYRGFGFDDMLKEGKLWVLSRIEITFLELPKWRDCLKLKTWVKNYQRSFSHRDFEIYNASGECIIKATSLWVMIDHANRRPTTIGTVAEKMPAFPEKHGIERSPVRVKAVSTEKPYVFGVRYGEIDLNNHVNNTKYLQWAIDSLSEEVWQTHRLSSITANYLTETRLKDKVEVHTITEQEGEGLCVFTSLTNQNQGKNACQIETHWVPAHKEYASKSAAKA
ncbi:acyl-[acyl-carrier-protein] thioesterase [Persicobacter psychrovividus]|uniref:Acyl-ACP thioesterase n=1 Tax=Persicobacter psychrovividus TaxID=387638 RepID=A0ABN6L972_9BACT|nr:acyl-ACP thioesterase [Persicobacter psychrovividus]